MSRLYLTTCLALITLPSWAEDSVRLNTMSQSSNILQMLLGLGFVIALIFALVWLIKKTGAIGLSTSDSIRIKACLPLSTKEKLMVVEVGEQQLLIGVAPGGISSLLNLEKPLESSVKSNGIESSVFSEKLKAILQKNTPVE